MLDTVLMLHAMGRSCGLAALQIGGCYAVKALTRDGAEQGGSVACGEQKPSGQLEPMLLVLLVVLAAVVQC